MQCLHDATNRALSLLIACRAVARSATPPNSGKIGFSDAMIRQSGVRNAGSSSTIITVVVVTPRTVQNH